MAGTFFGFSNFVMPALENGAVGRVLVQPMAIAYTRFHGMPMQRIHRPLVSWIGGADLLPQIMTLVRQGGVDAEVVFGEAFEFTTGTNRKDASRLADRQVRAMHAAALRDVT